MKHLMKGLVAAACLHSGLAGAQPAAGSSHAGHGGHAPAATTAAKKKSDTAGAKEASGRDYRSPFADYRPFTPQLPPKGWREANDDVREAGGHVGIMKGAQLGDSKGSKGGTP